MLRRFMGDPSIPMPIELVRSKWQTNPFFLGGICYLGKSGFVSHLEELGRAVPEDYKAPVLLFAGEATIAGHQGTLNGARLSGIREAERILAFTKCFCGPPPKPPNTCNF